MLDHAKFLLDVNPGDRYASTMAKVWMRMGPARRAVMSLLQRKAPFAGRFSVSLGLNDALHWIGRYDLSAHSSTLDTLTGMRRKDASPLFSKEDIQELQKLPGFTVWAIPPGTIIPPGMTQLLIEGPLAHALMLEVPLIQSIAYATEVATNAFSVVSAAKGVPVYEFSARRCVNAVAAGLAAHAAYMVGFAGTSNVAAARLLGIESVGTMAHALMMSEVDEERAFRNFATTHPDSFVALIDTYDPKVGLQRAIDVSRTLNVPLAAVRIDSGRLVELTKFSRDLLNRNGMNATKIMITGGLNPTSIQELNREIGDLGILFAVGDFLAIHDPSLGTVYKLAQVATDNGSFRGAAKKATGKFSLPYAHWPCALVDKEGIVRAFMLDEFPGLANGSISVPESATTSIGLGQCYLVDINTRARINIAQGLRPVPLMRQYFLNGTSVMSPPSFQDNKANFVAWAARMPPSFTCPQSIERLPFGMSPEYAAQVAAFEEEAFVN